MWQSCSNQHCCSNKQSRCSRAAVRTVRWPGRLSPFCTIQAPGSETTMVLITKGSSEAPIWTQTGSKICFICLQWRRWVVNSELPSNISTMVTTRRRIKPPVCLGTNINWFTLCLSCGSMEGNVLLSRMNSSGTLSYANMFKAKSTGFTSMKHFLLFFSFER